LSVEAQYLAAATIGNKAAGEQLDGRDGAKLANSPRDRTAGSRVIGRVPGLSHG